MAEVQLENVTKVYPGDVKAVDNVSLAIADREFLVLVGPSGCGKSTMLRMVAGLEEITGGTIRIGDRAVNDVPPKDRDVAMVFQNYALYPHMTVYRNMAFGLMLRTRAGLLRQAYRFFFDRQGYGEARRRKREIRGKVLATAKLLGIEDLLDRKPKALSGGQRQRVAVGRAIVRNPKVFLFDEPLSNLDAKLRVEMRAELKKLHRRLTTTTIYVTHDQEEAMTLGDRIVVMKDGVVQQRGEALEVYEYPANRFVAGFVGSPPMNFLEGWVFGENGHVYFDEGSNRIRLPERLAERLGRYEGRPITLGVRPESISDRNDGGFSDPENALAVKVSVVEPLGDKMDVYIHTPTHEQIVCRVDSHSDVREGMELTMHLDMSRVHLFKPGEAGVNVSLNGNGGRSSATA